MQLRHALASATIALITSAASASTGPPIERLVIFGDSLCDTGNIDAMTQGLIPGEPYYEGRFSNGPVWIEELAAQLDLDAPVHSIAGGLNYAFGGARTGEGFTNFIIPNMGHQLSLYFSQGHQPEPGDLFVLLGGANDFFMGQSNPDTVVDNLIARITTLVEAGAEEFLIVNLPPLGQTPGHVGSSDEGALDELTAVFNEAYSAALAELETQLDISIHRYDLHAEFWSLLKFPRRAGLSVVDLPAYDEFTGNVASNPHVYLFWDNVHPSATVHKRLGGLVHRRLTNPADVDADGTVDAADIGAVLAAWGDWGFALPEDIDSSGTVDATDLAIVISFASSSAGLAD